MGSRIYGSGKRNLLYFRNFDSGKEELSADYGSGRRNLQYFRKVGAGRECEELELRKWREKAVILP